MSYDVRIGVKVADTDNIYAVIDEPSLSSPTYNLKEMFQKCTGWNYRQGEWYRVCDVLPLIKRGIQELSLRPEQYEKYNAPNGWGTVESALHALQSMEECIRDNAEGASKTWNDIPLEAMYIRW